MKLLAYGLVNKINVLRGDVVKNNVYLTDEQKELIVLMAKERHKRIMELMERLTHQDISDEDYQIIRKSFVFGLDEVDDLCKAVYKKDGVN